MLNRESVIDEIVAHCERQGATLLYLTKFGAHLYGTDTEESDLDLKGVVLPSFRHLALREKAYLYMSSGGEGKNEPEDVDVEIWELQDWLMKYLRAGDTGAVDLLFSGWSPSVLYRDPRLDPLFENFTRLFDPRNTKAFIGYAVSQASRYGVKGTRLAALRKAREFVQGYVEGGGEAVLEEKAAHLIDLIDAACGDPTFCRKDVVKGPNGTPTACLRICGRTHLVTITVGELRDRIETEFRKYGERARKAEANDGLDFKALSHAVRTILEVKSLLTTGRIVFPLPEEDRRTVMDIKTGVLPWSDIERIIYEGLEDVDVLQGASTVTGGYDHGFVTEFILSMYKEA
jgi:hypothetical protein